MDLKHSLLTTRIIVIASIIGSVATLVFGTSFYPFYNYKLYPQPLGAKGPYTEYRIYTRAIGEPEFKRNPIRKTDSYDYDSYLKIINYLVQESVKQREDQHEFKKKLLLFAKHVLPGKAEYKIVSETYHPSDLLRNDIKYDTATVVYF